MDGVVDFVGGNFRFHRQDILRDQFCSIMADDVSWEAFGCYGADDYLTPNIDALAAAGVRFRHCYSTPICTPTRVKLMTGQYNFRNYTHFGYLNPKEKTFGHLMKSAGYKTAIAGKWQLNGLYNDLPDSRNRTRPLKAGFDVAISLDENSQKLAKNGLKWAKMTLNGPTLPDKLPNCYAMPFS